MKHTRKILSIAVFAAVIMLLATPVFAAVHVDGGTWAYGGWHEPGNWGAFSNYYHPSRWHWSSVVRGSDAKSDRGTAGAGYTSEAFINTDIGEHVDFDYGF